ncbi:MAG: tyrosine-type recombinase/integrase [Planctomycetota bacterium]
MMIDEALEKFLVQLEANGRSDHTIRQYKRHIRLFSHWIADVGHSGDVSEITHEDVARFLASPCARIRPDGRIKKAVSMNAMRTSLRGFFTYLHEAGFISDNPCRVLQRALCSPPPPKTMSRDEIDRLMETLTLATGFHAERDHLLFHLLLASGLRLGSALAINIEDIDLDRGEVWLTSMKGDRQDRVFLNAAIVDHLRKFIAERTRGVLFTDMQGRRLSHRHAHRRFTTWLQRAGIARPYSPHSIRHSFATFLYQRTQDVFLVKQALHHKNVASTLIYAEFDESRLRRALES